MTSPITTESQKQRRWAMLSPAIPPRLDRTRARLSGKPAVAVAVAMALVATALLFYLSRHLGFWWDEWTWILERRGTSLETYLRPHNSEHWTTVPIAIYQLLFRTVGIGSYLPYMAVLAALHAINGLLVFAVLRRRVGSEIALGATALLLFLGSAHQNLLWAFQVGYLASIFLGLSALMLLDVDRPTGRRQLAAGILLVLSVASTGLGLVWCAAIFVEGMLRQDRWRVVPVLAMPLAAYVLWDVTFGPRQGRQPLLDAVTSAPAFVTAALLHLAAALSGLGSRAGPAVLALGVVAVTWAASHRFPSARSWGALAGLLVFYGSIAATRSQLGIEQADESRYVYPGAVFALVIIAEATRSLGIQRKRVTRLVAAGIVVVAIVGNLSYFTKPSSTWWLQRLEGQAGQLSAAYLVRHVPSVDSTALIDPAELPYVDLGRWAKAVDDLGKPAGVIDEAGLIKARGNVRSAADQTLMRLFAKAFVGGPVSDLNGQVRVIPAHGVTVDPDSTDCQIVKAPEGLIDLDARAGDRLSIAGVGTAYSTTVYAAHFAGFQKEASVPLRVTETAASIRIPDVPGWTWAVRIEAPAGAALRVCGGSN